MPKGVISGSKGVLFSVKKTQKRHPYDPQGGPAVFFWWVTSEERTSGDAKQLHIVDRRS